MRLPNPTGLSPVVYIAGILLILGGFAMQILAGKNMDFLTEKHNPAESIVVGQPREWADTYLKSCYRCHDKCGDSPSQRCCRGGSFYNFLPSIIQTNLRIFMTQRCIEQRCAWARRLSDASSAVSISKQRLELLQTALTDEESPLFLMARNKYEEERQTLKLLEEKQAKIKIPAGLKDWIWMAGIYIFVISVSLVSSHLLRRTAASHISPESLSSEWRRPFFVFLLVYFIPQTGVYCYTSICKVDKLWIGLSSYFVSSKAWYYERISNLGVSIMMAIPTSQLWCYMKKDFIPGVLPKRLDGPSGKLSTEAYVFFLQTWTFVIFGTFAVLTVLGLRWAISQQNQFESAYLLITAVGVGLVSALIGRMIRNAIVLRRRYHEALARQFRSVKALNDAQVYPDPTIDFLGETWWKLPLKFFGIASATWAVLEWAGVTRTILDVVK